MQPPNANSKARQQQREQYQRSGRIADGRSRSQRQKCKKQEPVIGATGSTLEGCIFVQACVDRFAECHDSSLIRIYVYRPVGLTRTWLRAAFGRALNESKPLGSAAFRFEIFFMISGCKFEGTLSSLACTGVKELSDVLPTRRKCSRNRILCMVVRKSVRIGLHRRHWW